MTGLGVGIQDRDDARATVALLKEVLAATGATVVPADATLAFT